MKIKLKLGVSDESKRMYVTTEELGYTDDDWEDKSEDEKQNVLQTFVDNISEQPYWYLESFKTL